jgi:hypothetical protein
VKTQKLLLWIGLALAGIVFAAGTILMVQHVRGPKSAIIGRWRLLDTTICNVAYPREIEFFPDKQYVVSGFSLFWNGGRYAVVDRARVRMETRTGVALYEISLQGTSITFTNNAGCTIAYERVAR